MPHASPGSRLRVVRAQLGLSQREMAREMGVSDGAVALWETSKRPLEGPALRLLEMYELELGLEAPPEPTDVSWFRPQAGLIAWYVWRAWGSRLVPAHLGDRVRLFALKRYAAAVSERRGVAMKFAQMIGYLDPAIHEADGKMLASLTFSGPSIPQADVIDIVLEELGETPKKFFAHWAATPIAHGSIGQVHRARLRDGREVAVKVRDPRSDRAMRGDLRSIRALDALYCTVCRGQKRGVLFEELGARMQEEFDYRREAEHQELFRAGFQGVSNLCVPEVIASTSKVLATAWEEGESFDAMLLASQERRTRAAEAIWSFFWGACFRLNALHTDPNPANLAFRGEQLIVYDYGRVTRFSARFVEDWKPLVRALLERRYGEMLARIVAMGSLPDLERPDLFFARRYVVAFYLPLLVDGPVRFNEGYAAMLWRMTAPENVNLKYTSFPAEMVLFNQLFFGVASLLRRLNVGVKARKLTLDWIYAPGEARPEPFSVEELEELGVSRPGKANAVL